MYLGDMIIYVSISAAILGVLIVFLTIRGGRGRA